MINVYLKIIIVFAVIAAESAVFAAEGGGYANLVGGISVPDAANTSLHTVYGFTGGSRVTEFISLGGYHALSSIEDGPSSTLFSYSLTGLEARLNIASGEKNVFIGLRSGITKISSGPTATATIYSPYHYGLVSGYNVKVWKIMTIGFEGSYVEIEEAQAVSAGVTVNYKSFHTINFFATIGVTF